MLAVPEIACWFLILERAGRPVVTRSKRYQGTGEKGDGLGPAVRRVRCQSSRMLQERSATRADESITTVVADRSGEVLDGQKKNPVAASGGGEHRPNCGSPFLQFLAITFLLL